MNELLKDLSEEFRDPDFAHAYMEGHSVSRIAAQIHALRKQRGWTQAELAKKSGIAQERISLLESADFESLTLKTLNKLSRAFDVNLKVNFESFSDGIIDVVKLNPENLAVTPREPDLKALRINIGRPCVITVSSQSNPTMTGAVLTSGTTAIGTGFKVSLATTNG